MSPATKPRDNPLDERLLVIDPGRAAYDDARVRRLPALLRRGDLVVVNDAATLPASLAGATEAGAPIEARLAGRRGDGTWRAVLFGAGDWRTRTEDRPPPPRVRPWDALYLAGLRATVLAVDTASPRLVDLRFEAHADAVWRAIYRRGSYVQYAYSESARAAWEAQTPYAGEPWASEMPSAGRPLAWEVLLGLVAGGVRIARVTHAAGLSSTGDRTLDAALPLPERWRVPADTARALVETKRDGGRIVAVGTTVVRALESAAAPVQVARAHSSAPSSLAPVEVARAHSSAPSSLAPVEVARAHSSPPSSLAPSGAIGAGEGETDLVIGPGFSPRVVDGLFTGLHERGATHFALLQAFAPAALLERAYAHAEAAGYLCHEFGDSSLILSS